MGGNLDVARSGPRRANVIRHGSVALIVAVSMLAWSSQAAADPPLKAHQIALGSDPVAAPTRGATLSCDQAGAGGCTVFSPEASAVHPTGFVVPEHGGVIAVAIGSEPDDSYEFWPVAARLVGTDVRLESILAPQTPFGPAPWGAVNSEGVTLFQSPRLFGSYGQWDQPGYEVKKGQLIGINALGAQGPSLTLDPGARRSLAFEPALREGDLLSPGPLNFLDDLSLQMLVVMEREAALRAYGAWAFPDARRGFRQGVPFRLVVVAQNTSRKAAARDVIGTVDLRGRPFKGYPTLPAPCGENICLGFGTLGAVGQAKSQPIVDRQTVIVPPGYGKARIDVFFESQTIDNDQSTLANNRGSIWLRFKRKRGQGGRAPGCGRVQVGTPRRDRLNGNRRPNTLVGLQGNDILRGRGGGDCLAGSAGNDLLIGNSGNDAILGDDPVGRRLGKPGSDRIFPGGGRDYVDAGPGNDVINSRDRTPDIIDCGPGKRDRVRADRSDQLTGCEIRF